MPTITETPIQGYAHCRNPRCPGSRQEQVDVVRVEDSFTFVERGGDLPGYENSNVRFRFTDEDQSPCPNCGQHRDVTDTARPSYEALSGYDQSGLLDIEVTENGSRFDPAKQAELQTQASDKLAQENAELRERLAKLEGYMMGKQSEGDE